MKQVKILSALSLMAIAGVANAGVSGTVTATNDYDFRGVSQSATGPALQGSFDYADDSGWYIGTWASNVDFGPSSNTDVEVDLYTGFTGKFNDDVSWDLGIVFYTYPGESDLAFPEIYAGLTAGVFKAKVLFSNDFGGSEQSAFYVDTNVNIPLPANFAFTAHLGYSGGNGADVIYGGAYADYSAGVGYTMGNFSLGLKYVDNDSDTDTTGDVFNNEGRAVFTIATTFPWK